MTGFLLPIILVIWLCVCVWVAHRLGGLLTETTVRSELKAVVFLALLPLPLVDELIAKPQFDELCRNAAGVSHHAAATDGLRVRQADLPSETPCPEWPFRCNRSAGSSSTPTTAHQC